MPRDLDRSEAVLAGIHKMNFARPKDEQLSGIVLNPPTEPISVWAGIPHLIPAAAFQPRPLALGRIIAGWPHRAGQYGPSMAEARRQTAAAAICRPLVASGSCPRHRRIAHPNSASSGSAGAACVQTAAWKRPFMNCRGWQGVARMNGARAILGSGRPARQ